jgi:hypothetical protein
VAERHTTAGRRIAASTSRGRWTVALAGTWECGSCGAQGDAVVEEGDVFEAGHVCGEDDAEDDAEAG